MKDSVIVRLNPTYRFRLQVYISRKAERWQKFMLRFSGVIRHGEQHFSVFYHPWVLSQMRKTYGDALELQFDEAVFPPFKKEEQPKVITRRVVEQPKFHWALFDLETWIRLKHYSYSTLKAYKFYFRKFLLYYNNTDPQTIDREQIIAYLRHLVVNEKISETTQNQAINAIKCYYEKVLRRPKEYYQIDRPKPKKRLPEVLTAFEVKKIFKSIANLKHRCIIMMVYAGGLRLGEVVRLRVGDIKYEQRKIFIRGGKGKKDRYTLLSNYILPTLKSYLETYQPDYWLFEGVYGEQYSKRSVQSIFRKAAIKANVAHFATLHTLRHSFATHLMEQGVDTRYVQELLGHGSIETTMIYTHVAQTKLVEIKSPLDHVGEL